MYIRIGDGLDGYLLQEDGILELRGDGFVDYCAQSIWVTRLEGDNLELRGEGSVDDLDLGVQHPRRSDQRGEE